MAHYEKRDSGFLAAIFRTNGLIPPILRHREPAETDCMIRTTAIILSLFTAQLAEADTVHTDSGGQLRGSVVRDNAIPRDQIAVESPWGRISLKRTDVSSIQPETPAEAEYRRRSPTVSDTAIAQMALARWCRDHGLGNQLRIHAQRVLTIDPQHEEARQLLGYHRVNGVWMTRDDLLTQRGLIRHEGEYRTKQEIELITQAKAVEDAVREWKRNLRRLRTELNSSRPDLAREAAKRLRELNEPLALDPLMKWLGEEKNPRIKATLMRTVARYDNGPALGALVRIALEDPDPESRALSHELLAQSRGTGLAIPFVAALSSKSNATINLAADGLLALKAHGAVDKLVEVLISTHKFRVGNDSGGDTYSMNTATGSHSFGGSAPKIVKQDLKNPRVLNALVELTGVNFAYDQQAWRAWLASRQTEVAFDLRRDL